MKEGTCKKDSLTIPHLPFLEGAKLLTLCRNMYAKIEISYFYTL